MTDDKKKRVSDGHVNPHSSASTSTIESQGNSDAKLLEKAYQEYAKGGITADERKKIEALDNVLDGADIVLSKDGNTAAIAQDDGKTFTVKPRQR